jgi:hypothetical protein
MNSDILAACLVGANRSIAVEVPDYSECDQLAHVTNGTNSIKRGEGGRGTGRYDLKI